MTLGGNGIRAFSGAARAVFTVFGLSVIGALLFVHVPAVMAKDTPERCRAKPYVVKIHADWCGSCKALKSVWEQIETDLGAHATAVTLDVSDRVAYTNSQTTAGQLGIADFFHEYRSRTGTIAVLDCKTRKPVVVLNAERDLEKYREAIAKAGGSS